MHLDVGDEAPDFTLPDQDGRAVTLSALRGAPVLIYFYPRDETPGCTIQAQGIRDRWEEFTRAGVRVIGISPDDTASHRSFCDGHALPQTLLTDADHAVMTAYGAYGEKVLYGRPMVGVTRSSLLVGADGTVAKVWHQAQAKTHADRALTAIARLA